MTTITKEQRIEQIKYALFVMEFKDYWTPADWAERAELNRKLAELTNA